MAAVVLSSSSPSSFMMLLVFFCWFHRLVDFQMVVLTSFPLRTLQSQRTVGHKLDCTKKSANIFTYTVRDRRKAPPLAKEWVIVLPFLPCKAENATPCLNACFSQLVQGWLQNVARYMHRLLWLIPRVYTPSQLRSLLLP